MTVVTLPPDLERFAAAAVAEGRYTDLSDVVRAGLSLLRQAEDERLAFVATMDDAVAEAERDGCLPGEYVFREMDEVLADMARTRAKA